MANTTPEVITKDLGLVTAYGYALAGGYTGTEEQFKSDFAKLMQGNKDNLDIEVINPVRQGTSEIFISQGSPAHEIHTYLMRYGSTSFLNMCIRLKHDVLITSFGNYSSSNLLCYADMNTTQSYTTRLIKYTPYRAEFYHDQYNGYSAPTAITGFARGNSIIDNGLSSLNGLIPIHSTEWTTAGTTVSRLWTGIGLVLDKDIESVTLPTDTYLYIQSVFLNLKNSYIEKYLENGGA